MNIVTFEYEPLSQNGEINSDSFKEFKKYFSESWGIIKPKSFCGSLVVGNTTISILPKIERYTLNDDSNIKYLYYILQYVYDLEIDETEARVERFLYNNILEFFITKFQKELFSQIHKGFHREYINIQDNINKIKGRFLVDQDKKYNVFPIKFYCEFDEFSENNYLNQVFFYTVRLLKNLSKNPENKKRLSDLLGVFSDVDYKYFNKNNLKDNYSFNRLNTRFKKSYELAEFMIKGLMNDYRESNKQFFSFMFDMNVLFETLVAKIVKEIYKNQIEFSVELQARNKLGDFNLRPDIVILRNGKPVLIIDTKYKMIDEKNINNCDLYQVYSYGMSYPDWFISETENSFSRKVMLLYPNHLNSSYNVNLKPLGNGLPETTVNLFIRKLSLNHDIYNFKGYIENLKLEVKTIIDNILKL